LPVAYDLLAALMRTAISSPPAFNILPVTLEAAFAT